MKKIFLMIMAMAALKSLGQAPDTWSVDPNDFIYDMNIVALLEVNGRISSSSNDKIAAIIDDEIVGVGSPDVNVPSTGEVVVFLTVYSHHASGKTVTFRIYDAEADEVLDAVKTLAFENNGQIGSNTDPYMISDNIAPSDIQLTATSIEENVDAGSTVGTLSTTDENHSADFQYELVSGEGDSDNAFFTIDNSLLKTTEMLNYEVQDTFLIRLKSTDPKEAFVEKKFQITVKDQNDAPTDIALSNSVTAENNAVYDEIGLLSATDEDADETFSFTLSAGTDEESFEIRDGNKLVWAEIADYEVKNSYAIDITVTDRSGDGLDYTKSFVINISDVNEAPTAILLSNTEVEENNSIEDLVGLFTVEDEDLDAGDTHSYAFPGGTDTNDNFLIDGNELKIITKTDFEEKAAYFITIVVTDAGKNTYSQQFKISITDQNEPPNEVYLSNTAVGENRTAGTLVGALSVNDVDDEDTFSYSLITGSGDADNGSFEIVGDELRTIDVFNYETRNVYEVRIQAKDNGDNTFERAFNIAITDRNDAPTGIALSSVTIEENLPSGTLIGILSTDDQDSDDSYVYELSGVDANQLKQYFQISGDELLTKRPLDFEQQSQFSITVKSTDSGLFSVSEDFVIQVVSVNEAPGLNDTTLYISENAEAGTSVGFLVGTDEDGDNLIYKIQRNDSFFDESDAAFTLEPGSGELKVNLTDSIDYEIRKEIVYTIQVTDSGTPELKSEALLKIKILDQVETETLPVNEVITPNGDGYNDFFRIQNIQLYEGFTLVVYKGAGLEVYRKASYSNEWNGVSQNGKDLESGAYYYKFFSPTGQVYKGTVTIIRN